MSIGGPHEVLPPHGENLHEPPQPPGWVPAQRASLLQELTDHFPLE